ncbi:MAG: hypothetical protein GXX91_08760, partial [Verrucomicrobiaceae bacterium]|nr:hypothetical protein [Verrucomicrobiaceae bacterium]
MKLSMSRFIFFTAFLSIFVTHTFAQPTLSVNLEVSQIPQDGIFFGQVSLVSLKNKIQSEGNRFDAVFRDGKKTYPAQIVLEPHFDENHQAMLLISAPSKQQLKGVLELTPAPQPIVSKDDIAVASTKGATWEFSAERGIFPTKLQMTDSETLYTKYTWEDRLHSKKLSSYRLYRKGNGTLQLLSDGPVATIIRGQAHYLGTEVAEPPELGELPKATYDWYFFKNSPLVYVDLHQSASTGFLWDGTHFMEWNFKEKYFSGFLSNGMKAPRPLVDNNERTPSTTGWAALTSDKDAVAMIRDGVTIYDGVSGFGNYIRPREPSVNQVWDGNQRRLSAWLWASTYSSTSQLSSELNRASKIVSSRFAESNAKVVPNDNDLNISSLLSSAQAKDVASASWVRELVHYQGITEIPATWQFAKSGDLGIVLDVQESGAELVSLFDLKTNRELTDASAAPLFSVEMFSPSEGGVIALDASRRWGNVKFENSSTGLSLLFDDSEDVEGVSVEINALANNEDSSWTWSITIGNK